MTIVKIYIGMSLELLRAVVGGVVSSVSDSLFFQLILLKIYAATAAAAKSLQSCPTLCDPIDGSPPGSSIPGILQARILEWVVISFSNACMHAKSLQSFLTLCNPMHNKLPGSSFHGIPQARILEWVAISFSHQGLQAPSNVVGANYRVSSVVPFTSKVVPSVYFGFFGSQVSSLSNFPLDTRGRKWSLIQAHLFGHAVGREKHCKQISLVCVGSAHSIQATLGLPPLTECVLSRSSLLRLQVALQRNCLKWAMGSVPFPGLSCSCSGSRALHKGADSVGPSFVPFPSPRSSGDQVLGELSPSGVVHLTTSPIPATGFSAGVPSQVCTVGRDFFPPFW